jgi:hypothetical protein
MSLARGNANAVLIKKEFGISFPMCDKKFKKLKKNSLAGGNANALPIKKEFGISFPMCDKLRGGMQCNSRSSSSLEQGFCV